MRAGGRGPQSAAFALRLPFVSALPCPSPEPAALRAALSQFATGVAIVTTVDERGAPVGLTVNSFASVSLEPPLVLWSLAQASQTRAAFGRCSHFAIHVLSAAQRALAERFATRGIDRFAGLRWTAGLGGAPLLADALATFECRTHRLHPEGDHTIFVGEVLRCTHRGDAAPLLYHRSRLLDQGLAVADH